ncbi:MAG: hypothetical protein GY931_05145, partial [Maribacter sp.]|nr:hypothetical protein [Maribacter sp.]
MSFVLALNDVKKNKSVKEHCWGPDVHICKSDVLGQNCFFDKKGEFAMFTNLSLAKKIGYGFSMIGLVLALVVGITLYQISAGNKVTKRVIDLRVPTARTSLMMLNG